MGIIKITAIVGSLRRGSYNRQLAVETGRLLGDGAQLDIMEYGDVPFMNQDIEFPAPDAVRRVRGIVKSADAVWFFTPEYNHFFPGVLKNLIEWLSRPISDDEPQVLGGKPAAVSGITPGMSGTGIAQDHLLSLLGIINMRVMYASRVSIPHANDKTFLDGKLASAAAAQFLEEQCQAFIKFINNH
ncbi:MAG: NAD(P)H-dependent oxidoreductase [Oscillospiraceae bacterium]|nr:NAD(P)H-dependent oxidoreductase [Oscillospiraceae bacterium]